MSKYKPHDRRNCEWLIISATIYSIYKVTRITVGILELIRAKGLDRVRAWEGRSCKVRNQFGVLQT